MKLALRILWCLAITLWATSCFGQDQVETISGLKPVPEELSGLATSPVLTRAVAGKFVEKAFGPDAVNDPDFYCIVHILKWKDEKAEIEAHKWYVFRGLKWSDEQFKAKRIFGSHRVAILYVHLSKGLTLGLIDTQLRNTAPDILARVVARSELPPNATDSDVATKASQLISRDRAALTDQTARLIWDRRAPGVEIAVPAGEKLRNVESRMLVREALLPVSYRLSITKRIPAPVQSALTLAKLAIAQADSKAFLTLELKPVALWGYGEIDAKHVPSDVKVQSLLGVADEAAGGARELAAETYLNEGLYYWDVSVGVPVSKVKELEFNATDGTVRAKEIDKQKVFAFINIFPRPLDTEDMKIRNTPHLLFGVALSTKPLDRVFLGGGWGFNRVQFFAGAAFNKVEAPATLATGAPATQNQLQSDLRAKYETKFLMGLNVPVRQVLDAFKKK